MDILSLCGDLSTGLQEGLAGLCALMCEEIK